MASWLDKHRRELAIALVIIVLLCAGLYGLKSQQEAEEEGDMMRADPTFRGRFYKYVHMGLSHQQILEIEKMRKEEKATVSSNSSN